MHILDVFERIRTRIPCERVLVVDRGCGRLSDATESYESFIDGPGEPSDALGLAEDDACAMCYTSGTTGRPKGVLYSHRAIALHSLAISLIDQIGISRFDTVLPIVPMFHANAWGVPYARNHERKQTGIAPGETCSPRPCSTSCSRSR